MAADLGGSQISALLESVPGIVNVLRSPVADAIVNMIRAAAGTEPFSYGDAEELVQFAVRRGLIGNAEGERVLEEVKGASRGRGKSRSASKRKTAKGTSKKKPAANKAKTAGSAKKKIVKKKVAKKATKGAAAKRR